MTPRDVTPDSGQQSESTADLNVRRRVRSHTSTDPIRKLLSEFDRKAVGGRKQGAIRQLAFRSFLFALILIVFVWFAFSHLNLALTNPAGPAEMIEDAFESDESASLKGIYGEARFITPRDLKEQEKTSDPKTAGYWYTVTE